MKSRDQENSHGVRKIRNRAADRWEREKKGVITNDSLEFFFFSLKIFFSM